MNNRRRFLIKTVLAAMGLGIAASCHFRRKKIKDDIAPTELINSIWLPNWRMQKSLDSSLIALQQYCVRTVSPFWYEINDKGMLVAKPGSDGLKIPDKTTLDLLKKHHAEVLPTITSSMIPDNFIQLFSERSEQQKLAESIIKEVLTHDYEGIDLDLESIALTTDISTAKEIRRIFSELCQRVSSELLLVKKVLPITVMARWSDDFDVWRNKLIPAIYDYKTLSQCASRLRVMAYDQHVPNTVPQTGWRSEYRFTDVTGPRGRQKALSTMKWQHCVKNIRRVT